MKNINLKYTLLIAISFFAFSCDSDEGEVEYAEGNSYPVLRESEISVFDIDELMTFDVFVEPGATLSSLEVFKDDEKIADATVGEGTVAENTAVFNSSTLMPFGFEDDSKTGTIDLTVYSVGTNGDQGRTFLSVDVVNAISFVNEVSLVTYGDTTIKEEENAVISFETFTIGATIDSVTLFWKNGEDGTYVEDPTKSLNVNGDSINLVELDYVGYGLESGDELFYKLEAISGGITDSIETSVKLEAQMFNPINTISLSSGTSDLEYSLVTGLEAAEDGEISFEGASGFSTLNGIEFVKLTDTGAGFFAEYTDVEVAMADFNTGVPLTTTQVVTEDIYVYKVTRNIKIDDTQEEKLVDYYGVILINDVIEVIVNGESSISFDIQVKENYSIEIDI